MPQNSQICIDDICLPFYILSIQCVLYFIPVHTTVIYSNVKNLNLHKSLRFSELKKGKGQRRLFACRIKDFNINHLVTRYEECEEFLHSVQTVAPLFLILRGANKKNFKVQYRKQ